MLEEILRVDRKIYLLVSILVNAPQMEEFIALGAHAGKVAMFLVLIIFT